MAQPKDEHVAVVDWLRRQGCAPKAIENLIPHLERGVAARLSRIAVRPSVRLVWEGARPGDVSILDLVKAAERGEL